MVLDIFFEALNYEMIEQKKAYEVAGLLGEGPGRLGRGGGDVQGGSPPLMPPRCPGDIGGQMGLFIGASLLTILEIFDYLYEVFRDKLLSFYKEKKKTPRSDSSTLVTPPQPPTPLPWHSRQGGASHLIPPICCSASSRPGPAPSPARTLCAHSLLSVRLSIRPSVLHPTAWQEHPAVPGSPAVPLPPGPR